MIAEHVPLTEPAFLDAFETATALLQSKNYTISKWSVTHFQTPEESWLVECIPTQEYTNIAPPVDFISGSLQALLNMIRDLDVITINK